MKKDKYKAKKMKDDARALERKQSSDTTEEEKEQIRNGLVHRMLDEAGNICEHEWIRKSEMDAPGAEAYVCPWCGNANFISIEIE